MQWIKAKCLHVLGVVDVKCIVIVVAGVVAAEQSGKGPGDPFEQRTLLNKKWIYNFDAELQFGTVLVGGDVCN